MSPLFCSTDLATRLERAESDMIRACSAAAGQRLARAPLVLDLAGGVATCTEPGSALNKVAGLGFGGAPDGNAWDAIEREYDARGVDVRVELSTLGDPSIAAVLTRRGYELLGFENVLGRALPLSAEHTPPSGVAVESLDEAHAATWLDVVVAGFAHPDAQGVPSSESYPREQLELVIGDMSRARGFRRYLARVDGVVAGGASLCANDGVALLCGAATLPALRRRGVQRALLLARLSNAAAQGCDVAVVTTQPGSKSQQNVHRIGFELLYARAVLVRPPATRRSTA